MKVLLLSMVSKETFIEVKAIIVKKIWLLITQKKSVKVQIKSYCNEKSFRYFTRYKNKTKNSKSLPLCSEHPPQQTNPKLKLMLYRYMKMLSKQKATVVFFRFQQC